LKKTVLLAFARCLLVQQESGGEILEKIERATYRELKEI
jgi:hypothetical protein